MKKIGIILCLLALLILPGCGAMQTLLQGENKASTWVGSLDPASKDDPVAPANSGVTTVALYFADVTGQYLVKEERSLPKTAGIARETVTQWLKGPMVKNNNVQAAVSPSTSLLDIGIKEGVATIDLSKEFLLAYGNTAKELSVYGLVNTLTQFPTVKEVKLRIEGKVVPKVGDVDTTHLAYRADLLKTVPAAGTGGQTDLSLGSDGKTGPDNNSALTPSPSKVNLFGGTSDST